MGKGAIQLAGRRNAYFDVLRVLAILLVVFNHLPGYLLYQTCSGLKAWAYMLLTMFTRINVPLFLMVSGALLLGKEESTSRLIKHRVSRIVAVTVLFSALCYFLKAEDPTLGGFFRGLLGGGIEGSYWFLYAYLGMLLLLPFLRFVAVRLGRGELRYLLILHLIVATIVPMASYAVAVLTGDGLSVNLSLPLATTKQLFYPLVGYYLGRVLTIDELTWKRVGALCIASLAGMLVSSGFTYYQGMTTGYTQDFVQLFDWVSAIAVFVLVRFVFEGGISLERRAPRACRAFTFLGPLTFGVYLFDPLLKRYLYGGVSAALEPLLPTLLVSFAWCLVSFVLGCTLTFLLKRVPGFRAIL